MLVELPCTLTLPSGARVTLLRTGSEAVAEHEAREGAPLFSEVIERFDRDVMLEAVDRRRPRRRGRDDERIDVGDLPLADFHVIRAVLIKSGLVHEDEVELECHNCGERLVARPCDRLEIGPWRDGELDDPELDRTAELGAPQPIAPIRLGRVRQAHTVTLAPVTVRTAMPLFAALARPRLEIDEQVVQAMGIRAIGAVSEPRRIAELLTDCDDAAFESITRAFLAAHYPLRLACDVFCSKCKARNTIDAPAVREFSVALSSREREGGGEGEDSERPPLPSLDAFAELAYAIAAPLLAEIPGEKVQLVVEGGTPAVDDGGEPLLGSYEPPPPADAPVPTRPPTVTVYYRTFEAIEREEGRYDWEAELRETIEHELEHHVFFLRGEDPMDEEEHAEIEREAVRIIGRGEATRRTLASFGQSILDFFVRAWPLVLIAGAVLAITLAEARCAP
jgi:hypothetical protein